MSEDYTLIDELERKALDALSRILSDFDAGAISQPAAAFALRTLFDAVSGLVGADTFDLISEASKKVNETQHNDQQRRLFVHASGTDFCLLEYQYGEAEITVKRGSVAMESAGARIKWHRDSKATFEDEPNPFEAAAARFKQYAETMQNNFGFVEIK